jgi:hypothetical protein
MTRLLRHGSLTGSLSSAHTKSPSGPGSANVMQMRSRETERWQMAARVTDGPLQIRVASELQCRRGASMESRRMRGLNGR